LSRRRGPLPAGPRLSASRFAPRQAPSKEAVRQLCQECFSSPPAGLGPLAQRACPAIAAGPEEAAHVVYRGLTRAEDILALFPENFHQNLKNLLTKIILENMVDIKTSSDTINRMAVPTCLLQLKIQEDAALCGNSPVVSALTVELSKETLDTMLEGLGRIRDQLSAVANK
uniref:COMM domain containing 9 n=1 Tax=Anser cygnoides TaxID=8845 RepID=A0A8B9DXN3_ANSCY